MHPHRLTFTRDPDGTPVWSQSVTAPLSGLVDWSADPYDCAACDWTCEPVNRAVLGDRWGGLCAFHAGVSLGARDAAEWDPEADYAGWLGWRRAARAVAAVALAASHGDYSPRERRAARRAARATVGGSW